MDKPTRKQLAKAILTLAADGQMPQSFWFTDARIQMALKELAWSVAYAHKWAEENCVRETGVYKVE